MVSIVIVCMNNLKNLYPCLNSIRQYTTVSYETFVVAYLFSKDNLARVRKDFPWVTFIESDEIRGFSENNNLALRQAKGRYCFVVNDDTEMKMPVVDRLLDSFGRCPGNTAIVSPVLLNAKGDVSVCGRNGTTRLTYMLSRWGGRIYDRPSEYVNGKGLFRTYNIIGAAFMIRTDLFREAGWFDERYFFCPEDIALSTALNKAGYFCYVNADVEIYHYEGMSGKSFSLVQTATRPAGAIGGLIFASENKRCLKWVMWVNVFFATLCRCLFHYVKATFCSKPNVNQVLALADKNTLKALIMNKTPKETFIYFYKRLPKNQ